MLEATDPQDGRREFKYEDGFLPAVARVGIIAMACMMAYDIRLYAIRDYGLVIHEFDPWFNFRATEYLHENGAEKFFHWYDHRSWYPLGRPVGSTIYPGMQFTSVYIFQLLERLGYPMSLNDICCYVPVWFGVIASLFTGLIAYECTMSKNVGAVATAIMAIVPAHIMRSVGGGYDNESVAMTAMTMTFYLWCRSLRNDSSWWFGALAGLAYFYMVAAWGGYIFVLNMVGVHAAYLMIVAGRFTFKLQKAYSLFYVIGTALAIQIPVVGYTPIKSLEQLGPFGVFALLNLRGFVEYERIRQKMDEMQYNAFLVRVFSAAVFVGSCVCMALYPTGYFGPLSSRIRGLFVPHTRTGNPLVDSVAEHKAASPRAYYQYLQMCCYLSPIGFSLLLSKANDQSLFLILYGVISYYFSAKMVRLIILLGPIASVLTALALVLFFTWIVDQVLTDFDALEKEKQEEQKNKENGAKKKKGSTPSKPVSNKKKKKDKKPKKNNADELSPELAELQNNFNEFYEDLGSTRKFMALGFLVLLVRIIYGFYNYAHFMAKHSSNPSIMFKAKLRNGKEVLIDDYREAYFWLRDNTPEDSRVMAWWDYGYQLSGIAKRITIADGNTWNHEHIATLGRCLVSPEEKAHDMIIHMADYVLIWSGGGGDDLAKSPHIARISNSVYPGICPEDDPLCKTFGFVGNDRSKPTDMMKDSLIYKLHSSGQQPGVSINEKLFKNVYNSEHGMVRIYKVLGVDEESKKWSADSKNKICDDSGWLCRGQYPPMMQPYVQEAISFAQLEDFNVKKGAEAEEYQKKYHAAFSEKPKK